MEFLILSLFVLAVLYLVIEHVDNKRQVRKATNRLWETDKGRLPKDAHLTVDEALANLKE